MYLPSSLQTGFLREVVGPAVRDAGMWDRFFFLRYWQGGPHIRLRIDTADEDAAERVRHTLVSAMPSFTAEQAEEYQQQVSHQAELATLEGEQPVPARAAGTVEPAVYSPEYAKYGGTEGVRVAEELFRATSAAVLDLFSGRDGVALKAPAGAAMRIMAMSLKGSGLDLERSREFLGRYERQWRAWVPPGYDETWSGMYDKTGRMVTNLCRSVWSDGATDVFHDIYAKAVTAAREVRDPTGSDDLAELSLDGTPYFPCLANYIHTTNNRLGILPVAEAFLAYVIGRCMDELSAA